MQNSLYQFTLRVFPTDAIGPGGAAMGALVPCYAGAVDYRSALNSTFRILRCMAEGVRKSLQEGGRDLDGLRAGPGHG